MRFVYRTEGSSSGCGGRLQTTKMKEEVDSVMIGLLDCGVYSV